MNEISYRVFKYSNKYFACFFKYIEDRFYRIYIQNYSRKTRGKFSKDLTKEEVREIPCQTFFIHRFDPRFVS